MTTGRPTRDVSALVENMFADVLTADERAELLVWIRRWEAQNPGVDAAHRVTGWIDVAYAFQERIDGRTRTERIRAWETWGSVAPA